MRQAAELAARCGWGGEAVLTGGRALVDHDGALLRAEPRHFRTTGVPPGAQLLPPLETFRIRPRMIVEFGAGDGETAIYLARRFPAARVIAVAAASDELEALEANLALQSPPLANLEIALNGDGKDGPPELTLQRLRREFGVRQIDLLIADAGAINEALAASIRALPVKIVSACVSFPASGSPDRHGQLLAAFDAAGLMLLEKRTRPVTDGPAWLSARLAERAVATAWFVERKRVAAPPRLAPRLLRAAPRMFSDERHRRVVVYGLIDRLVRMTGSTNRRFEFERVYSDSQDPWRYTTNDYEIRKYQRTLETALAWRRGSASAVEMGCSIGVYTRMLARSFGEVTAVDVAHEALVLAKRRVGTIGRVRYVRSDIRGLDLGRTFDLIFCAEMLYYLPDEGANGPVLKTLKRHLAPNGILMTVMPGTSASPWRARLLEGGWRMLFEDSVADAQRPYQIHVYDRVE